MAGPPAGKYVACPECGASTFAIVPKHCELVDDEDDADGKVWVNCHNCENHFIAHYSRH